MLFGFFSSTDQCVIVICEEKGKEKRGRREKGEEVGREGGKMEGRRDGERGLCKLEPEL